jgi:hypothetical protein
MDGLQLIIGGMLSSKLNRNNLIIIEFFITTRCEPVDRSDYGKPLEVKEYLNIII